MIVPANLLNELEALKARREQLNTAIELIEKGIAKASYDACMQDQLRRINDSRVAEGKRPMSMSWWASGVEEEE